jgi:integrase
MAARQIGDPYGGIVEMLALTGQRREEVARCKWDEMEMASRTWELASQRTKNAKGHEVYLSDQAMVVLSRADKTGMFVFSRSGTTPFQDFSLAKRELDQLSGVTGWRLHDLRRTCVSGMARLGVAPHVADKILNHQNGTISGVAAVSLARLAGRGPGFAVGLGPKLDRERSDLGFDREYRLLGR